MIDLSGNVEFLLAFVSAILGLSVPVMLQVIERVDQRYESTRLAERLKHEPIVLACICCLVTSLICNVYTVFIHIPSPWDYWLINNSADLLALLSCLALIGSFLFSCKVILSYYNPEKLQDRILEKYDKAKTEKEKERAFLDWVDLTKALLRSSDREPAFKVYDTLGRAIYKAFEVAGDDGVTYPSYLVRGITSINENLCLMQRRPYSINNGNQILKNLISKPTKLSDEGYSLLWNNLQLQLFYDQEDWMYEYWSAAVQNYDLELPKLYEGELTNYEDGKLTTAEDVLRRTDQRKRYLEFHVALCASIMREQRYDLLEKLMEYYRSMTPEYEYPLVPSSVADVLDAFEMVEESPRLDFGVEKYYPLRGIKGITDGMVIGSIKRYLTYLYVRVFSNIGRVMSIYVNYPNSIGGLKRMDEHLDNIKRVLPLILGNAQLMKTLSFSNKDEAQREMYKTLVDFKSGVSLKEKELKRNKPNEQDIVEENLKEVVDLVKRKMAEYNLFVCEPQEGIELKVYYLRGMNSFLYPNEAFQTDAGISYVNMAETVTGASIMQFQHGFASVFYQLEQRRFKIGSERLFEALDKLRIDAGFAIVSFNMYWDFYFYKGIEGLKKEEEGYSYRGIQIISLHGGPTAMVSQTLFVMPKSNMPVLTFIPPVEEHLSKYELKELEKAYCLYGSIVKLNDNAALLEAVDNMSKEQAEEHSLFNVFINAKVSVNSTSPVVSIRLMHDLRENGKADKVDDIIPFEEMFVKKEEA